MAGRNKGELWKQKCKEGRGEKVGREEERGRMNRGVGGRDKRRRKEGERELIGKREKGGVVGRKGGRRGEVHIR